MLKRCLVVVLAVCFSSTGLAEPFWHCIANNKKGAVWNWYAGTEQKARSTAEKACVMHNDRKSCEMVCFPPRVYWRCLSHDTPPVKSSAADVKPTEGVCAKPTKGTWYWSSFSKQIAINGARDACRHNSPYGGCTVDENACASS